jgi:AcrR family transcriptional regulator
VTHKVLENSSITPTPFAPPVAPAATGDPAGVKLSGPKSPPSPKHERSCYYRRVGKSIKEPSKGEQTRQAILAGALSLVSELGYEGLSIGVLAEKTHLSKSGLFAHFKSKEALQLGVIQEVINQFTLRVVQPALAAPRGEPRLRVLFEKDLEWIRGAAEQRGCLLQRASADYRNRIGHPVRERLVQAMQDWWELLTRCAQTAIDAGQFRPDLDAEQFVYEFDAITMMYQHRHVLMGDRSALTRAQTALEALLDRSRALPKTR